MASHPIYQFYAELEGFEPKIWRRFQVSNQVTVSRFSYVVMILFEMMASHLYSIEVDKAETLGLSVPQRHNPFRYSDTFIAIQPDLFDFDMSPFPEQVTLLDASSIKLRFFVDQIDEVLRLNYDFGDNWWVRLVLEDVFTDRDIPGTVFPRVLEGSGYGIVEDCGGIGGLLDLIEAFKQKHGEAYESYRDWTGFDDFDIQAFDIDDMNFRLKKLPMYYKHLYEDQKDISERGIALFERNYSGIKK
ncbi:MAG: plasmid pRiA4b ORF-3 family protein [Acholeplasmatales bacterium]|nr:MAG: plasmid pRiA4b ORF-3 family protein [Acholeplasmatales bacterium]